MINLKFSNTEEPFYDVVMDKYGTIIYFDENNDFHNSIGPAIEYKNGDKEYWIHGELHKLDGPAVICSNGYKEYWVNGVRHRLDGPAIESSLGYKEYRINDELHRLDGPAVIYPDGNVEYWVNNNKLAKEEFDRLTKNKEYSIKNSFLTVLSDNEEYSDYSNLDIQPEEFIQRYPSRRKEKEDIVKYRLEQGNEETFFEKGQHQNLQRKEISRPIIPYGSLINTLKFFL